MSQRGLSNGLVKLTKSQQKILSILLENDKNVCEIVSGLIKEKEGAIKNILMTDVNNPRLLSQDGNL